MIATEHWSVELEQWGACSDAVIWARLQPSAEEAWQACQRGDRMLWVVGRHSGPSESEGRKRLVLCSCECARLALPYTKDARVLTCIETAERWARGGATMDEVTSAKHAAYAAAAYATYAAYAADAAYAVAVVATYPDAGAADAAYAAAAVADAAAAADARSATLTQCADIVRKHYPTVSSFMKGNT